MTARRTIVWTTVLSVTLIVLPVVANWSPRVLWNASASVPVGLYLVLPADAATIGDLVAVQPPPALTDFLVARGYLPRGVPLLKHVVALEGAFICRSGDRITVDPAFLAEPRRRTASAAIYPYGRAVIGSTPGTSSS